MSIKGTIKDFIRRITGEIPTRTLIRRGLRVGADFNRQQGCYIDPTHCFLIEIGDRVTMSVRVTLLAHDASTKGSLGYTKIGNVRIGDDVFIGANATVLPGVSIGSHSVIGANSVVTRDIPENTVAAGNPARVICSLAEFTQKHKAVMENAQVFGREYRFSKHLTQAQKDEMREAVSHGIAFID